MNGWRERGGSLGKGRKPAKDGEGQEVVAGYGRPRSEGTRCIKEEEKAET